MQVHLREWLHALRDSFLDRSATRKPRAGTKDAAAATFAALAAIVSGADLIGSVLTKLFGDTAAEWLPLLLTASLLVLTVFVVKARQPVPRAAGIEVAPAPAHYYEYAHAIRQGAKVLGLLLIVVIPMQLWRVIREQTPLPSTFEGLIVQERNTAAGVADATVRLIEDGRDITKGLWLTDSSGFYTVTASRPVSRKVILRVAAPGCSPLDLQLTLAFQVPEQNPGVPMFRHVVDCPEAP
jgi:hypothetical protein